MLGFVWGTDAIQRNNKGFMPSRRAQFSWERGNYRTDTDEREDRELDSGTQTRMDIQRRRF